MMADELLPQDPQQPAQGVAVAQVTVLQSPEQRRAADAKERADVKRWMERIDAARKYDEEARKQYAKDRRYARGDTGSEVAANLIGTYIDILESFLYARDPDVDVRPARSAEPPSLDAMRDAAEDHVAGMPDLQEAQQQAYAGVLHDTGDPSKAQMAGKQASDALRDHLIQKQFNEVRKRFQRAQRDAKAFADTLEIIVSRLWKDARLKTRGTRFVRSALSIGIGVMKAAWEERTAPSPETVQKMHDLQAMVARLAATRAGMDEQSGEEADATMADYQRQLQALQAQAMQVVARGFVVDVVPAEDFQVAPGFMVADYLDAPWVSHRIPMRTDEAKARFALTDEQVKQATKYAARKPVMQAHEAAMLLDTVTARDADAFVDPASSSDGFVGDDGGDWVMVEEIWDAGSGSVLTGLRGVPGWVKEPWQPQATTRFFPFFVLAVNEVDGQRHPQSLVARSAKLVDEYNRIGTAEAEHRRRVLPGILVNAGKVGDEQLKRVVGSAVGEYTPVQLTQPSANLREVFFPKQYPQIDPMLYDRSRIINELERIWGIQEALSGSVNTAKTATEAQIQQSGFQARTGGRRDALEMVLGELAQYTAEVARANVSLDDARAMAGQDAMWPEYTGADDLAGMVTVDIRAGSSGKPDTVLERQAWAQQLPLLQQMVMQIGQLRGSDPGDIADSLEELAKITAERSGDRIDIGALLPQAGEHPQQPMPAPGGAPAQGQMPMGAPDPQGPIQLPALAGQAMN